VPDRSRPTFHRAVIALTGGSIDTETVRIAVELAKPSKAELVGVHVVEIDWAKPLDADVAGTSEEAQRILDQAESLAERLGHRMDSVLVQARAVGAAIVDEAVERDADLLILGLPYRTKFGGDFALGRWLLYALKNAPCAVWVVREPMPEEYRS
jgi:nucleotide-binding universal stress UspA family protein